MTATQQAAFDAMEKALKDCADDLEIGIRANYGFLIDQYPSLRRKFDHEMQTVIDARAALAQAAAARKDQQ